MIAAAKPPIGASAPRARARRYVQGRGRYSDDFTLPRMVHATFLRSPYPHARIERIDTRAAAAMPGVVAIAAGREIAALCKPYTGVHALFAGYRAPEQYPLAVERTLWQGEPVAIVIAASRALAEDAVERIEVDWREMPAISDVDAALAHAAPQLHQDHRQNLAYDTTHESGDVERAFAEAAVVVSEDFRFGRHTGVCLETRTILADFDPPELQLTVRQSHQCPSQMQDIYARLLGLDEHKVRVVCPDVGGAFGIKQQLYGDELAVCAMAMRLGRPVKYVADRLESLMSDIHARDHAVSARMAFDRRGRLRAVAIDDRFGIGAYSQFPRSSVGEGSHVLRLTGGPYAFDAYRARLRVAFQNKAHLGHYRAVGHPIAVAVTERLMDMGAAALGVDPLELRRRNFIPDDAYPWKSPGGFTFDRMDLRAALDALERHWDFRALRAEQAALRGRGSHRGIGVAVFLEMTGTSPGYYGGGGARISAQDGCTLKLEPSGKLRCAVSVTDQGQGTDTGMAQVVAAAFGVPLDDVRVLSGDTEHGPYGGGAWASRGAYVGGEAAWRAARALRDNVLAIAAPLLQSGADALDIRDGSIVDAATGVARMPLADVAAIAYFRPDTIPGGVTPELVVTRHFSPRERPFLITNGIHASQVEVDVETGFVRLLRHAVVHDAGTLINPRIVDEQIRGGVVQGLGAALYEEILYGPDGQLQTGSLADYLVPMAAEMPEIDVVHLCSPAKDTAIGAKGVGEAGTAGASAAVLNAVNDAIAGLGGAVAQIPLTPQRVLAALGKV